MKPAADRWVVDASVGIKLCLPEAHSSQTQDLFDPNRVGTRTQFYVPDLFYVECANILWKHVRRFGYPRGEARKDIEELRSLALRSVPTADLIPEALDLALKLGISAYDACYLALAEGLGAPLVTADEKLFHRLKDARPLVRWIGDPALLRKMGSD